MRSIGATAHLLGLLGDPTRLRLLRLLEGEELSVAELVRITELPQPRVSTHLRKLREAKLVIDRRQGNSNFYRLYEGMNPETAQLWQNLRNSMQDPRCERDIERKALAIRARHGRRWPEEIAGEMERHYSPGRSWESTSLSLSSLVQLEDVLDIGCGDGALAQLIASRSRRWVCFDHSPALLDAARKRLSERENIDFVRGDMHDLPFEGPEFDQVLHIHALTYAADPQKAVAQAARVLRPGGHLLIATLAEHQALDITAGYGHVQPGFHPDALREMVHAADLQVLECSQGARESSPPYFEVLVLKARRP